MNISQTRAKSAKVQGYILGLHIPQGMIFNVQMHQGFVVHGSSPIARPIHLDVCEPDAHDGDNHSHKSKHGSDDRNGDGRGSRFCRIRGDSGGGIGAFDAIEVRSDIEPEKGKNG